MKNLKKNQIAIYAISLMLVAAGYFNYVTFESKVQETYSEDIETQVQEETANVGDAVLVNNDEIINENANDYFVSSKLDRDKMYANMITNYEAILNNTNCTEAQKTIATQEITKINNTQNCIMICENLLSTKGFSNCIVLVNEESVNIVVGTNEKLQQDKVAIIQNIISREMKKDIQNIHITEKTN